MSQDLGDKQCGLCDLDIEFGAQLFPLIKSLQDNLDHEPVRGNISVLDNPFDPFPLLRYDHSGTHQRPRQALDPT